MMKDSSGSRVFEMVGASSWSMVLLLLLVGVVMR